VKRIVSTDPARIDVCGQSKTSAIVMSARTGEDARPSTSKINGGGAGRPSYTN